MEDNLTEKQLAFIAYYCGEANFNATKAAQMAGYSSARASGTENLANPRIKQRINDHLDEIRQHGYANKAVRIAELNSLYEDLKYVQKSRAREAKRRYDDGEDIPEEAYSGVIVETVKTVGQTTTHEWSFDKAWHDSALKTLDQIAKEVGDRDKKIEMSGPNGGPIQVESGKAKLLELIDDGEES